MWCYCVIFGFFIISASTLCNDQKCVKTSRMIASERSEQNSRPFQVALYLRVGTTGQLGFCGGSLIHQQWVITAAHCCFHDDVIVDNVQVILGAHSLYDRYENGRRVVNVDQIEIHPDWDPATFANDLALLRLANVVQLTDTIDVVRLPYLNISTHNFAGAAGTVSGWGIAGPRMYTSRLLMVTFVSPTLRGKVMTVMTNIFCNSTYFNRLPPNVVCGFSPTAGTCKGDNGGPMTIFYNNTEEDILIGVATFIDSSGCNDEVPSVFTRVQFYLDWISNITGMVLQ